MEQNQANYQSLLAAPPHYSSESKALYSLNSYQVSLEKKLLDQLKKEDTLFQDSKVKKSRRKKSNSKDSKSYISRTFMEEEKPTPPRKLATSQGRKPQSNKEVRTKNSLTRYYGRIMGENTESTMCSAQEMKTSKYFCTPQSILHSEIIKSKRPTSGKRSSSQKQQVFLKRQLTAKRGYSTKKTTPQNPELKREIAFSQNKSNISVVEVYEQRGSVRLGPCLKSQLDSKQQNRGSKIIGDRTPLNEKLKRLSSQFSQSNISNSQTVEKKPTLRIKRLNKNQDWPYLDTSISNVAILEASPIKYRRTVDSFRTPKSSAQRKNPISVNKLINLQLSASSMASHKWGSQTTKSRIQGYHVTSPSMDDRETKQGDDKAKLLYSSVRASIQTEDREDIYLSNKCINHQIYNEREKTGKKPRNLGNYGEKRRKLSPSVDQSLRDDALPEEERQRLGNVLNLQEREKMLDSFIKRVQRAEVKDKVVFGRKWSEYACEQRVLYEILQKKEREKKKEEKLLKQQEWEKFVEKEKEKQKEKMKAQFLGHSREMSILSSSPAKSRKLVREELRSLFATTPQKVPNSGLQKV